MASHAQTPTYRSQAAKPVAAPAMMPTVPPLMPFLSGSGKKPATIPASAPCGAEPSAISKATTSGRSAAFWNWAISLLEQLEPASCCCGGMAMIPRLPSAPPTADAVSQTQCSEDRLAMDSQLGTTTGAGGKVEGFMP
jgi:hypothetical protein